LISSEKIRSAALAEGFSLCGIARAEVLSEHGESLRRWLDEGMDGGLEYMRRAPAKRLDPAALVEGARSVVVCAVNYKNAAWNQSETPRIASYAYARDYHTTIKTMLHNVMARFPEARGRAFCDTAPILEKAWAVRAGLGWVGKNSLLVTPDYGSFVLLGLLVLDGECDAYDTPRADGCGTCTRCIDACPNAAITAPHIIDARRCIARITLEKDSAKDVPTHGWSAGCDACQSCCPYNRNTPLSDDPRWAPVIPAPAPGTFWRTLTEEQFDTLLAETPLARRGYASLRSLPVEPHGDQGEEDVG
jgi:epoxyqueuosine reductase